MFKLKKGVSYNKNNGGREMKKYGIDKEVMMKREGFKENKKKQVGFQGK